MEAPKGKPGGSATGEPASKPASAPDPKDPKAAKPGGGEKENKEPSSKEKEKEPVGANGVAVASGPRPAGAVRFGTFDLDPRQVFYVSASGLTRAIVNLKPLVPGHVLVVPAKNVP